MTFLTKNTQLSVSDATKSGTPSLTGPYLNVVTSTYTDSATDPAGTCNDLAINSLAVVNVNATNPAVTISNATTLYIEGAPGATGEHVSITNPYTLWLDAGTLRADGQIECQDSTDSTSTSTGSIVTSGGVGIAKKLYVGDTTASTSIGTGSLVVSGGISVAKNSYISGIVNITDTTESTSVSTGALVVSGGAGIEGDITCNGNISFAEGGNIDKIVALTSNDSGTNNTISPDTGYTNFGQNAAISFDGNYVAIYYTISNVFKVDVYFYNGSSWALQQTLTNNSTTDGFGNDVSFGGNSSLAIAANNDDKAYVYTRSGSTWSSPSPGNVLVPGESPGNFGNYLEMGHSGSRVIITDQTVDSNDGALYSFTVSGDTWSLEQKITSGDTGGNFGYFGCTIARITEDRLAGHNTTTKCYIFSRSGSTWGSEQTITVTGVNILAGISMSGSGNYLALGTLENGGTNDRKVLIYSRSGTSWSLQQTITNSSVADFGTDVVMSNNERYLLVTQKDGNTYIYYRSNIDTNPWSLIHTYSGNSGYNFSTKNAGITADGTQYLITDYTDSSQGVAYVKTLGDNIVIDANNINMLGNTILTTKTPSNASDTGTTGTITYDSDFIYICTATNTWKRVAISTW